MDKLLLDLSALGSTLTAFKDLIEYYVVSLDSHATETRAQLRQSSSGGDVFLSSLCQDLDDICTYCGQIEYPKGWDDSARSDIRNILTCLSNLIITTESSQVAAERLEVFRMQTSGWDYQNLGQTQHKWLKQNLALQQLSSSSRRTIIQRSAAAAQLLHQDSRDYGDEDDTGTKDVWALRTAIRLSEPLRSVHEILFQDWDCRCHCEHKHSHVLISFATPCQTHDLSTKCLLKFATSRHKQLAWSTVSLDITADGSSRSFEDPAGFTADCPVAGATSDQYAAKEAPLMCLHDQLVQMLDHCTSARVNFLSDRNSWTLTSEPLDNHQSCSMVSLASLTEEGATHHIREQPYAQRVALALVVTYAFLELGNSPWFPYTLDEINIWFRQVDGSAPVLLQPFLEVGLNIGDDVREGQSDNHTLLRMINSDVPCLPVLGKLLLELISGTSVALGSIERFMGNYQRQNPERAPYVWGIIRPCFFDNTFKREGIHGNENLRTRFLEEVIHRLHKLLSQCNESLEGEIAKIPLPPEPHFSRTQKRRRNSSTGPGPTKRPSVSPSGLVRDTTIALGDLELVYCLHDDGSQHLYVQNQAEQARAFIQELQRFHAFFPQRITGLAPVKVAILDTGFHICARTSKLYKSTPVQFRSWLSHMVVSTVSDRGSDSDGHGTQCATTFLQCIHNPCELFIGQVFGNRKDEDEDKDKNIHSPSDDALCISQAIKYAVEVWGVDIISMSFGFERVVEEIDDALKIASDHNVLLLAAASNVGGNTGRAQRWPATRNNVISIAATEGNGFEYKGNPPPRENDFNFATLGVMVPVWTAPIGQANSQQIYRSGTSIATPVAAAIAASIIEFVRRTEEQYVALHLEHERTEVQHRVDRAKKAMSQAAGMSKIFSLMAVKTGRYNYLQPTNLLTRYMTPTKLLDRILDKLDE